MPYSSARWKQEESGHTETNVGKPDTPLILTNIRQKRVHLGQLLDLSPDDARWLGLRLIEAATLCDRGNFISEIFTELIEGE